MAFAAFSQNIRLFPPLQTLSACASQGSPWLFSQLEQKQHKAALDRPPVTGQMAAPVLETWRRNRTFRSPIFLSLFWIKRNLSFSSRSLNWVQSLRRKFFLSDPFPIAIIFPWKPLDPMDGASCPQLDMTQFFLFSYFITNSFQLIFSLFKCTSR